MRWNESRRSSQSFFEDGVPPLNVSEMVPTIRRVHAEAALLFDLRRHQRFQSKIVRLWRLQASSRRIASEVIEVKDSEDSKSLTSLDSPALGQLLFGKVLAALNEDVKATLRFPL
jgi:hypothetical protein